MKKIILTVIMSHFISGLTAITVLSRNQRKLQRNQILMTVISLIVSQINTILIMDKIEKPTN